MYMVLILSILVLLWGRVWLGSRGMAVSQLNLASVTIYRDFLLLTMFGIGYHLTDSNYLQHYILNQVSGVSAIYIAAFAATYFMLVFIVFFRIFGDKYFSLASKLRFSISREKFSFFLKIWTGALVFLMFYLSIINPYGVFYLFSGDTAESFNVMRHELSHSYGSGFSKQVLKGWVPPASYAWFYLIITSPNRAPLSDRLFFVLSLIMGLVAGGWYFEKSAFVLYFIGFVGIWLFSGRKISAKFIIFFIITSLLLIAGMYIFTYGDHVTDWFYVVETIIHRVATQASGVIMAFEWYPESLPLKGFSGISNFLASLSGDQFSTVYTDLIRKAVPETQDVSGALSSFAVGDAYGLFGWLGVLISPIILALYYGPLEYSKCVNDLKFLVAPIYGFYFSHDYIASAFFSFFWPIGFVTNFLPLLLIFILSKKKHNQERAI